MVGLGYFVLAPLTVLTLNGGFKFPAEYAVSESWSNLDLSRPQYLGPYVAVWLCLMLTFAVVYFCCPVPTQKQRRGYVVSRPKLERLILITMAISVVDWVLMIWLVGGISEFLVSHWYTRQEPLIERFGSVFILYMRLSLVNQILFTAAATLYASQGLKHRNTRWRFTALVVCFFVLGVVMSGNRIFIALYLLSFLVSCWLYERKKILSALLAASPLIVLIFSVWGWVRQDLSRIPDSVDTYVINADLGNRAVTNLMDVTEGAAVMLLLRVINDFGSEYPYLYGKTYSRLFTFFQTGISHPERTPDFQTIIATRYEPGADTSLGSTSLGEAFANFGLFGIFGPPLLTGIVLHYSKWLTATEERHRLLSAVSFILLIFFARSTFATIGITLLGATVLIWVLRLEVGLCARTTGDEGYAPAGLHGVLPLSRAEPSA
jgi:oligosaccharide repeat unit polymerase